MASRIKGITVEIGGDTSGLEKSLSAVNNSIKKTQSQLRDVNNSRSFCSRPSGIRKRSWKPWSRPRKMWRKPLRGGILEKISTWHSSGRWRRPEVL